MIKIISSIVHKCIFCNFLIDELMKSKDLPHKNLFMNIKNENLRNIRTLCYLYEYLYKDVLILDNVNTIELCKNLDENLNNLFKILFEIISDLKILNSKLNSPCFNQFINGLLFSYFNFTSCLNCFFPTKQFKESKLEKFSFSKKRIENDNVHPDNDSSDTLRKTCIESIDFFFDYPLSSQNIKEENYEVFFENNPNNKFYQFFFDCDDRLVKVRISVKDTSVFYMYQVLKDSIETSPSMTNEDAKFYSDSYLNEKLGNEFNDLIFDKDYLNIYSYMNIPESYKFKYNFKDNTGKVNLKKGIYITIDARYIYIQELYLF